MKIKTTPLSYQEVLKLDRRRQLKPKKPLGIFRWIIGLISKKDLKETSFTYTIDERIKKGPFLILMNHSSFIDFEIAETIFKKEKINIIATSDCFVGQEWLIRNLGCIPTNKFTTDKTLIPSMKYCFSKNRSVLMYPEASYSFDGCATPLPKKLGVMIKYLDVPVVMIKTQGAFLRDPLYNCLQKRNVKVSANVSLLVSKEDLSLSTNELEDRLTKAFTFDNFKDQLDNNIIVNEPFRADGLERVLYKCKNCGKENTMLGKGITLTCNSCGKSYTLLENGQLQSNDTKELYHIPDLFKWERNEVLNELLSNTYSFNATVNIGVLVNYKSIYMIGDGVLTHNNDGFKLTHNGETIFTLAPNLSYSLYSDYYWYEIGDVICIGNSDILYYCFPKEKTSVAKVRLATEELFKLVKK